MTGQIGGDDAVKELVRQHWNGRAETFEEVARHGIHSDDQRDRWLELLREWAGDDPSLVLDIGCGTGVVSRLLAELGHDVVGVDFATGMLERARANARRTGDAIELVSGDAEALPLRDGSVALLAARHLLWTLPNPTGAIREWRRVVEPGGRILLVEGRWNLDDPRDEYERVHGELPMYRGRPPEALDELLVREGLEEVAHEPLRDPVLWGREPRHEYYIVGGTVPG